MTKVKGYNELKKAIRLNSRLEWEIAVNTNNERGKVYNQEELLKLYPANGGQAHGATKTCYLVSHESTDFKNIVIKRCKTDACICNQCADEIDLFTSVIGTHEETLLCPILAYYKCKSDKVYAESDKAYQKYMIISQKAVDKGYLDEMVEAAGVKNGLCGIRLQNYIDDKIADFKAFCKHHNLRDCFHNSGNAGIIYDYAARQYKPVLIDYGLDNNH